MNVYAISYDLDAKTGNYEAVKKAIDSFSASCQCLESTWLVASEKCILEVENEFVKALSEVDRYFIVSVKKDEYSGRAYKRFGVWKWILAQLDNTVKVVDGGELNAGVGSVAAGSDNKDCGHPLPH